MLTVQCWIPTTTQSLQHEDTAGTSVTEHPPAAMIAMMVPGRMVAVAVTSEPLSHSGRFRGPHPICQHTSTTSPQTPAWKAKVGFARHDLTCSASVLPGCRRRNQSSVPASIEPVANKLLTTSRQLGRH